MNSIKILHIPTQNEPFLIVDKPSGIPSAPLTSDDKENALIMASEVYPEILKVAGKKEIEYGLIHRLDTATSGLLMIAVTQQFYDYIIQQQKEGKFYKTYYAECDSIPDNYKKLGAYPEKNFDDTAMVLKVKSYFRPYGPGRREVRPVTEDCGKAALSKVGKLTEYSTEIAVVMENEDSVQVLCRINNGFRHQVRSHLSWCGLPVKGDNLYNINYRGNENCNLHFAAVKLEFTLENGVSFSIER